MVTGRADHYRATLADLEQRKADYLNEIKELDGLIAGIAKQIQLIESLPVPPPLSDQSAISRIVPQTVDPHAFKNMSVRWAILKLFGENQIGLSLPSSEIAKALETGGVETRGERFVGNVSAVVSAMKQKGEIEAAEEGRYRLTVGGREAWNHIQHSQKYLQRLIPIAS